MRADDLPCAEAWRAGSASLRVEQCTATANYRALLMKEAESILCVKPESLSSSRTSTYHRRRSSEVMVSTWHHYDTVQFFCYALPHH